MSLPWRHGIVLFVGSRCSVVVRGAFGVFVIEDSVRMHAVGTCGVVLENDLDCVADFGAKDWSKDAGVLPLRRANFEMSEGFIRVLAVNGLAVDGSDPVWPSFGKNRRVSLELHAHHLVNAAGSVVPVHFIGGNVVGADLAGRGDGSRLGYAWCRTNQRHADEKRGDCPSDCDAVCLYHLCSCI